MLQILRDAGIKQHKEPVLKITFLEGNELKDLNPRLLEDLIKLIKENQNIKMLYTANLQNEVGGYLISRTGLTISPTASLVDPIVSAFYAAESSIDR